MIDIANSMLLSDLLVAVLLLVYSLFIIFVFTKRIYSYMIKRGFGEKRAAYLNRKIVHISIGGFVSAAIPFIFHYPFVPALAAWILGFYLLYRREKGSLMYWFQVRENAYEVNFAFAWGAAVLALWTALGNPFVAMLPPMLVSFGDGVTGIVRNLMFKRRTKHWAGNLAMALLMVPIGFLYAGAVGVLASLIASYIERFEFGIIDDNVLIVLSSSLIILGARLI
ncbi:MAG: dolichol kinase [Fervidicoccaceae archaeon]